MPEVDFAGSTPELAVEKETKQIRTQVKKNFQASKEKRKWYHKMMGKSRLGLALLAEKLEATLPQASVLQVCHFGNLPVFRSTEPIDETEY